MHIVLVHIHVKSEKIEEFRLATIENARSSIREEGVLRFDFLQQAEDSDRFVLIEVYKNSDAQLKHRETTHYNTWKEAVTELMAEPRQGLKYLNIYPDDSVWTKQ